MVKREGEAEKERHRERERSTDGSIDQIASDLWGRNGDEGDEGMISVM